MKNIYVFKQPPLKPFGLVLLNFIWRLLWMEIWYFVQMVTLCWPRCLSCPYTKKKQKKKTKKKQKKNKQNKLQNLLFLEPKKASRPNLGISHWHCESYQIYSNDDLRLIFFFFLSFLEQELCFPVHLYGEKLFSQNVLRTNGWILQYKIRLTDQIFNATRQLSHIEAPYDKTSRKHAYIILTLLNPIFIQ